MYDWEMKSIRARPPGARVKLPILRSKTTIRRSEIFNGLGGIYVFFPRYLAKYGLKSLRTVKVPLLLPRHKKARLDFARQRMTDDWSKVCICAL